MTKHKPRGTPGVTRVLFVCTANQCRSPMAKALMEWRLEALGLSDQITVDSAGVLPYQGIPATPEACDAIRRTTGRDLLAGHLSKWALGLDLRRYDLILTMTEGHKHRLPRGRTFTIKELVGMEGDVEDPVGRPPEEYDRCCSELSVLVDRVIEKLTA